MKVTRIIKYVAAIVTVILFLIGCKFFITIVGIPMAIVFWMPAILWMGGLSKKGEEERRIKEIETAIRNSRK